MGKRYSEEEKRRIQELTQQGHTDESIAQQLGRSTNAIRNIRHRNNIKTRETRTIQQLNTEKQKLTQQTQELEHKLRQLEKRRDQLTQALQIEEKTFYKQIETTLIRLKDQKPELFTITEQEQISKLTAQLAGAVIRWLITE
ncbi:helix-turn-helix domain-containing protein [Thermoproteota archaeon]